MARWARPVVLLMGAALLAAAALSWRRAVSVAESPPLPVSSAGPAVDPSLQAPPRCFARPPRLPSGAPPMLSCRDARRVIAQVRARLPSPARLSDAAAFADALIAWLDPHGLWSAAPDAPVAGLLRDRQRVRQLLEELERSPRDDASCDAALSIGKATQAWVEELRGLYAPERQRRSRLSVRRALTLASQSIFEDDPVTRPARLLATELGRRASAFERALGDAGRAISDEVGSRLLPTLAESEWQKIVLAAAVRAYVPLIDAHGQWAPLEEEWSLYAGETSVDPGPALWGQVTRTSAGVLIVDDPAPPLEVGDLVLSIGGIQTGGLSIEQLEQLSRLESIGGESARRVSLIRGDSPAIVDLEVEIPDAVWEDTAPGALEVERVRYGGGSLLVLTLLDVPDGLGEQVVELLAEANLEAPRPAGIVLDLRGNGGGSPDGASALIGAFIPGAPSFPLRRRSGKVEVERAMAPPLGGQWHGPVAALVDGYTASAAEMIAAALASYRRGPVLGTRTFGKGCIQEYFDDRSGAGVLRLTTMLFAQPDGSPLQQVGLEPTIALPWPAAAEREASLAASMPPWSGPDVRDPAAVGGAPWPAHHGRVGPCRDRRVCEALRRLGPEAAGARRRKPRLAARSTVEPARKPAAPELELR